MATKHIQHLRSKELIDDTIITREDGTIIGDPKAPTADQIKEGEIAINYNAGNEQLFIKNSDGNVVSLLNKDAVSCITTQGQEGVLTFTTELDDDGCVLISGKVELLDNVTDDTYVLKMQDSEGTLLLGMRESGEIYVPIGTTEDSYDLIYALYEKLADVIPSLIDYGDATYDTITDRRDLIEMTSDNTYTFKVQDVGQNLLIGIKESGEVEIPIGVTDDSYTLINALYEKLNDAIPVLQDWVEANYENAAERKALIDSVSDDTYVMKMQDNEGNLLQGFKESGEVEIPIGVSDETYKLFIAIYNKLNDISDSLAQLFEINNN